jgi:heptosyltransferase-2
VHLVDVPWLARGGAGASWPALVATARAWRRHHYDVVVNFEPDIRSNFLAWLSGAAVRTGYRSGGGGAFLTDARAYDPSRHVGENAEDLVTRSLASPTGTRTGGSQLLPLAVPEEARQRADTLLGGAEGRLIGVHASGGRPSKQWHPERFAAAAETLARRTDATIVLTGSDADRSLVDRVRRGLTDARVIDVVGQLDLPSLTALLARLDLLLTGDTGPMHLADAVGTPIVVLFGPSDPRRYGPRQAPHRVLRIDLPCSPCGRVRMPPARCRGRVPECLDGISPDAIVAAATELLQPPAAV